MADLDIAALQDHVDNAVRKGLVAAGVKGPLFEVAGPVTRCVLEAFMAAEPLTPEQVADVIDVQGGFVRVGRDQALVSERFVDGGTLIDALLILRRRDVDDPDRTGSAASGGDARG